MMVTRFKQIVSRRGVTRSEATGLGPSIPDRDELLRQGHAGVDALRAAQDELRAREHALLAEASVLYEQLTAVARDLDDVRRQRSLAAERETRLRGSLALLEPGSTTSEPTVLSEPRASDAFAIQAQD
jgi:hypothetical protein